MIKLFSTKIILTLSIAGFAALSATILYQKYQKSVLRDDIISLNMQVVASEASYNSCLVKIDDVARDLNQKLITSVDQSNFNTLKLEGEIKELKYAKSLQNVDKIQDIKKVIDTLEWSKQKLPLELMEQINEKN
jgi:cell division protein FtsL|tara:strand:- start:128 stop:529 length:402 start_codon:yes stop_codon:yes gene_type:complete